MGDKSVADKTISHLKSRLDSAIKARCELEQEFSTQSVLLTEFIGKLSQACKGTDIFLDNKLAKLRSTLKTSANFADLEKEIKTISALLQQHSVKNDKKINKVQEQILSSALSLQKAKIFSANEQRQLTTLIDKTKQSQTALMHYLPLMSEFIILYQNTLQANSSQFRAEASSSKPLIAAKKSNEITENNLSATSTADEQSASQELLDRFNSILNTLVTSTKHKADIKKIKSSLKGKVSNHILMTKCLHAFDLIIDDLQQERSTARVFLSTLSDTLSSVHNSVISTIASTAESNVQNDKINQELKDKISDMNVSINGADSLTEIKAVVNGKLQKIAKTLEKKSHLEEVHRLVLQEKFNEMSVQVERLESQSQHFEKRIKEHQTKSMQDALTKLANRAAFDEHFAKEIVRYHHKKFDLAITVIDIDNFKRINDNYGHTAGDKTLQVIANTLMNIIAEDAFISRYGGEEFVLVFKGFDKINVINKLNVLRKKVESLPFTFKGNRLSITLSMGVTLIQKNDNVHSAFERADTALYRAKNDGKNRVIYG